MSRQHAKIMVLGNGATLHDLGSRNGSRINGQLITAATELHDGDRVRLGTQELVFFRVRSEQRAVRATGAMRLCVHCTTPFPEGPPACPHCGKPAKGAEDDTMSGLSTMPERRAWVLQMLTDMLDRVIRTERYGEAEKLLYRAAEETENRVVMGDIDPSQFARVAELALSYSTKRRDTRWAVWVLDAHRRALRPIALSVADGVQALLELDDVRRAVREYLDALRASAAEEVGFVALERAFTHPRSTSA